MRLFLLLVFAIGCDSFGDVPVKEIPEVPQPISVHQQQSYPNPFN